MRVKKIKYHSINGLRAISITLVILNHLSLQKHLFSELEKFIWLKPFTSFLQDGHLGVNVFFVISGFLITSLMINEENETHTISLRDFYIRRVLRIFPAYYFLLVIYFILQLLHFIHLSDESWLTAITCTKYFNWDADWITAHMWSLSIEEHFYFFWPLMFVYGYQYRKTTAIALILAVPVIRVFHFLHPINWINELTIFMRIDAIATGCWFALYKDILIEKIQPYWKTIFYSSIITIFLLPVLKAIAGKMGMAFIFIPFGTTHGTIANFAIGLLMMYSIFGPRLAWFKFLNLKVINYIGILSYSIYLWQQLFISELSYWFTTYPYNLLFVLIAATSSYYFIEKPFLLLKTKFSMIKAKVAH